MHEHGPNCLPGPIRGSDAWWRGLASGRDELNTPSAAVKESKGAIRKDLVERVRREITAGTYDTPERWEAALDRLLDCIE